MISPHTRARRWFSPDPPRTLFLCFLMFSRQILKLFLHNTVNDDRIYLITLAALLGIADILFTLVESLRKRNNIAIIIVGDNIKFDNCRKWFAVCVDQRHINKLTVDVLIFLNVLNLHTHTQQDVSFSQDAGHKQDCHLVFLTKKFLNFENIY